MPEKKGGSFFSGDVFDVLPRVIAPGNRYGAILVDYPWPYRDNFRQGGTSARYKGMPLDRGCELGHLIQQVALPDAYLFLWVTRAFLHQWYSLMLAWGFEYTWSSLSWHKEGGLGGGNLFRIGHEILVVGRRGNVPRFLDRGLDSRLVARRGEHSEKPLEIYDFVMRRARVHTCGNVFASAPRAWVAHDWRPVGVIAGPRGRSV